MPPRHSGPSTREDRSLSDRTGQSGRARGLSRPAGAAHDGGGRMLTRAQYRTSMHACTIQRPIRRGSEQRRRFGPMHATARASYSGFAPSLVVGIARVRPTGRPGRHACTYECVPCERSQSALVSRTTRAGAGGTVLHGRQAGERPGGRASQGNNHPLPIVPQRAGPGRPWARRARATLHAHRSMVHTRAR